LLTTAIGIVGIAVEGVLGDGQAGHVRVADLDAGRIATGV
jgi:hypothetical protein